MNRAFVPEGTPEQWCVWQAAQMEAFLVPPFFPSDTEIVSGTAGQFDIVRKDGHRFRVTVDYVSGPARVETTEKPGDVWDRLIREKRKACAFRGHGDTWNMSTSGPRECADCGDVITDAQATAIMKGNLAGLSREESTRRMVTGEAISPPVHTPASPLAAEAIRAIVLEVVREEATRLAQVEDDAPSSVNIFAPYAPDQNRPR